MKKPYLVLLIVSLIVLSSVVPYSAEAAGIPKKAISTSGQWAPGDIPDLSSSYQAVGGKNAANGYAGLDSGTKVPNYLLPDVVVRTNQTNTFGAGAQTFPNLVLGGNINVGSYALTNAGHASTLPATSGTLLQTNGTFSGTLGTLLANTFSYLGHVITIPSNTGTLLLTNGSGSSLTGIPTSITGTAGNITASPSTGAVTLKLGSNVVVTGGDAQTVSKALTLGTTKVSGLSIHGITVTGAYSISSNDDVIRVDATSAPFNVTLPSAVGLDGKVFTIKKIDASITNEVYVKTVSSQTIDGAIRVPIMLATRGQSVLLQSDNANWHMIAGTDQGVYTDHVKGATRDRYMTSPSSAVATATSTIVLNTIYSTPLIVENTVTIDQLRVRTVVGGAGSTIRAGIYLDDGNLQPGRLLLDAGQQASTASTASLTFTANLPITLTPGVYWVAMVNNAGTAPTVKGFANTGLIPILGVDTTLSTYQYGYSSASCSCATLPDPYPGLTAMTGVPLPMVGARVSG